MSELRSIETEQRGERQQALVSDAAELAADSSTDSALIGYTILALYSDGSARSAGYRPRPEDHRIGSTMYEAVARAILESHFAYGDGVSAAHDVLAGRN